MAVGGFVDGKTLRFQGPAYQLAQFLLVFDYQDSHVFNFRSARKAFGD